MPNRYGLIVLIGVLGLVVGLGASVLLQSQGGESTYCNSIQQQIKANQSFTGSVACYPPGEMEVNVSDKVDENTELRCVCRIVDESGISIFPVAVSN
ncbi:MAG: hypothetical protein ACI8Z7_000135 [Candidatus Nanohaloarchaea archaeon]|jgi:hypothetical protein